MAEIGRKRLCRQYTFLCWNGAEPKALMVQVAPLQGLTAQEHQTTYNRGYHPSYNLLFGIPVSGFYCQNHGHRTHNQDKGHDPHKNQWVTTIRYERDGLEYLVRIRPGHMGETLRPVIDQKG